MGAGRTELLMTIFGAWEGKFTREIEVRGKHVDVDSPGDAIRNGIGFVTEDRKRFGLILEQTILDNMTLAALKHLSKFLHTDRGSSKPHRPPCVRCVLRPIRRTTRQHALGRQPAKIVLGKWLLTNPRVLFRRTDTRIDVGAKQRSTPSQRLASEGVAIGRHPNCPSAWPVRSRDRAAQGRLTANSPERGTARKSNGGRDGIINDERKETAYNPGVRAD